MSLDKKVPSAKRKNQHSCSKAPQNADYSETLDSTIDILNDDCLIEIFNLLSLVDRVRLETVCQRWKRASRESWRTVTELCVLPPAEAKQIGILRSKKILEISANIDKSVARRILPLCGHFITDCTLNLLNPELLPIISDCCRNIVNLKIRSLTSRHCYDSLQKLLSISTKIKTLCVFNAEGGFNSCLRDVSTLALEKLSVFHMSSAKKSIDEFNSILEKFECLKVVDLTNANLTLETLEILGRKKCLTELIICDYSQPIFCDELMYITENKNLECVYLDVLCHEIWKVVKELVKNCQKLRKIQVFDRFQNRMILSCQVPINRHNLRVLPWSTDR